MAGGTGNGTDNVIIGNSGKNLLSGLGGNDTLEGGVGNDTLDGGAGNDTASYSAATARVAVSLAIADGQDTGGAGFDTLISIENLKGSALADALVGNAGDNALSGMDGNDTLNGAGGNDRLFGGIGSGQDSLNGGTGADTMRGGLGNDLYYVDNSADVVDETGGDGVDKVFSSISLNLAASTFSGDVENLVLIGSTNINGTGNKVTSGVANSGMMSGAARISPRQCGAAFAAAPNLTFTKVLSLSRRAIRFRGRTRSGLGKRLRIS